MSSVSVVTALFRLRQLQLTETLPNTPELANTRDVFVSSLPSLKCYLVAVGTIKSLPRLSTHLK